MQPRIRFCLTFFTLFKTQNSQTYFEFIGDVLLDTIKKQQCIAALLLFLFYRFKPKLLFQAIKCEGAFFM